MVMRVILTYDDKVDAAYLRLYEQGEDPGEVRSMPVSAPGQSQPGAGLVLDFDAEGRLIGVEFLSATSQLRPSVLASAERP